LRLADTRGAITGIVAGQAEDPRADPDARSLVTLTELAGGSANAMADPERWLRAAGAELASRGAWGPASPASL
jgi:glycerate 2-kinase